MTPSAALPVLRTLRLTLRPFETSDADALTKGVGNYDVSKWLSVVPYPYRLEDAERFIERVRTEDRSVWAICTDEGLVGAAGLEDELGYWIARPAWGRGYAFEAARAVTAHWFETRTDDLVTGYFDGNERSGAILRALGFRVTHRAERDARALSQRVMSTRMLLTRADWDARQHFTLRTPRLTLRPIGGGDAAAFAALTGTASASGLGRAFDSRPWRGYPGFTLGIERGGRLVGSLGFGGDPLSVDYFLLPDLRGQGLMTEALSAFLPELFARFPVNRLTAGHRADDPEADRLLERLGFVKTRKDASPPTPRLEPAPLITYALTRDSLKVPT